jgi:hypothetical protein
MKNIKNISKEDIAYENRIKNIEKDIQIIKMALMKRTA